MPESARDLNVDDIDMLTEQDLRHLVLKQARELRVADEREKKHNLIHLDNRKKIKLLRRKLSDSETDLAEVSKLVTAMRSDSQKKEG